MIAIEDAAPDDAAAILSLLERTHLPKDGIEQHLATALVARRGTEVVGSAALEVYADGALLRSVAVDPSEQRTGLGSRLTEAAAIKARALGVPALYLLTTTAEHFFPRFGFARIERRDVPPSVQQSIEFQSVCPASAIVMRKPLTTGG